MADVFNSAGQVFKGAFSADGAKVQFAGGGALGAETLLNDSVGLLAQQIQAGYSQQVSRFYEVGTNNVYMVRGRAEGNMSMARILGPRKVATQFYKNYGDVCNMARNVLNLTLVAGCGTNANDTGSLNYTVKNIVLTSISFSVGAQDMVVNEQVGAMFVSLEAGEN